MSRDAVVCCVVGVLVSCAMTVGCDGPPSSPTSLFVSAVSPSAGLMLGSTVVTISGVGFQGGATVRFGDTPAVVKELSSTRITAQTPAHQEGLVDVIVTNPDGQHSTRIGSYTFELDVPFTISGVITELTADGEIPVQDVQVAESATRTRVQTDHRGAYRLAGLRRSAFVLSMVKAGYETLLAPVTSSADRQIDMRLARFGPFVLSGMVYENTPAGRVPLEGVVLYCDGCGSPIGHTFVTTDALGLYSFSWTQNGSNWIQFISKEGYRYAGPLDRLGILVKVNGDTRFDIELVKR